MLAFNDPQLEPDEKLLLRYLQLDVIAVRRLSTTPFDVEVDFQLPFSDEHFTSWLPLHLLYTEWQLRPAEIAALAEDAGGARAYKFRSNWAYSSELTDEAVWSVFHGLRATIRARYFPMPPRPSKPEPMR
jgi:hypothetical protein